MKYISLFIVLCASPLTFAANFNIRDHGALGDGTRLETESIQHAIDAAASAGGGTVVLPPGRFLSGSITLKSHVTLQLDAGAFLLASQNPKDYPEVDDVWREGEKTMAPFIFADGAENITITGRGTIDGQGESWWRPILEAKARGRNRASAPALATRPAADRPEDRPAQSRQGDGPSSGRSADDAPTPATRTAQPRAVVSAPPGRPQLIRFIRCKDVVIEHVTCVNSPAWNIHPMLCERVRIDGVTVIAPVPSPNTDGINPESCRNVQIINCRIDVGDDCVTLKSGINELGRKMGRPNEDITIANCVMYQGHGGVSIGSEMSGGVRNVTISNCVFHGTDQGIRIKSQRGRGGVVEGISVSNIVMQDVPHPFTITTFYMGNDKPEDEFPINEGTPRFRDLHFSNITVRGAKDAGSITGLKEMFIENVTFNNVRVQAEKGFMCTSAKDVSFQDVVIDTKTGPALTTRGCGEIDATRLKSATTVEGVEIIKTLP